MQIFGKYKTIIDNHFKINERSRTDEHEEISQYFQFQLLHT